jgi:outer membrane protein OmpA-like peptidoglycan-associated protein
MKYCCNFKVLAMAVLLALLLQGVVSANAATWDPAPALEVQEAGLRIALAPTAAVIVHAGATLRVQYPGRLAFLPDTERLRPEGTAMLDLFARSLRQYPRTQVVVAVYTDALGGSDFNKRQSQARASAVVSYLHSKGVARARLVARGIGDKAPLTAENTPEGRDLNRRLELTITPLSS